MECSVKMFAGCTQNLCVENGFKDPHDLCKMWSHRTNYLICLTECLDGMSSYVMNSLVNIASIPFSKGRNVRIGEFVVVGRNGVVVVVILLK